jgi:hypothetical protein
MEAPTRVGINFTSGLGLNFTGAPQELYSAAAKDLKIY